MSCRDLIRQAGVAVATVTGSLLVAGTTLVLFFVAGHPGVLPMHIVVPIFYNVPLALAFAVVATAILRKLPGHPVGLLFGLVGVAIAFGLFTEGCAAWDMPGTTWVLWIWTILTGPTFFGLAMALLLFPTGQLPSPPWRWHARLLWAYVGASVLVCAAAPWPRGTSSSWCPCRSAGGGRRRPRSAGAARAGCSTQAHWSYRSARRYCWCRCSRWPTMATLGRR